MDINKDSVILHINSKDRSENLDENQYSTSYFKYFLDQPIKNDIGEAFLLSLHSSIIPYSFYNIRAGINNRIPIRIYDPATGEQIAVQSLDLTAGSYTVGSLITELEAQFITLKYNAYINDAIVVNFNRQTQKFIFNTVVTTDNNKIAMDFSMEENTAHIEMGFREDELTSKIITTAGSTAKSSNVVDVNGSVHSIFIRTSLTSTGQLDSSSGGFTSILGRIPIETNFGSVLFFNPTNSTHQIKLNNDLIQSLIIKITDDNGRIINLNGLNFTISLEFTKLKKKEIKKIPRFFNDKMDIDNDADIDNEIIKKKTKKKNKKKNK